MWGRPAVVPAASPDNQTTGAQASALCPSGKVAVGGGYAVNGSAYWLKSVSVVSGYSFTDSESNSSGWRVEAGGHGLGVPMSVQVQAICVNV